MDKEKFIPSAKVLRNILIIMWSCLAVYLIIKLLGGNWFEIACQNERFIKVCDYMDNHFWAMCLITTITSYILFTFLYLAMFRQWTFTKFQLICFLLYVPSQYIIKNIFIDNTIINLLISFISSFVFPVVLYTVSTKNKITWKFILVNVLLSIAFDFSFQFISLLIKNMSVKLIDNNLTALIFQ